MVHTSLLPPHSGHQGKSKPLKQTGKEISTQLRFPYTEQTDLLQQFSFYVNISLPIFLNRGNQGPSIFQACGHLWNSDTGWWAQPKVAAIEGGANKNACFRRWRLPQNVRGRSYIQLQQ